MGAIQELFNGPASVNVLLSGVVDFTLTADQTVNVPAGYLFFPDEVGIIVTQSSTVISSPSVRFGVTGALAQLLAPTGTAVAAVADRQVFAGLLTSNGQTTLTGGITVAASAATLSGYFYWKGLLLAS